MRAAWIVIIGGTLTGLLLGAAIEVLGAGYEPVVSTPVVIESFQQAAAAATARKRLFIVVIGVPFALLAGAMVRGTSPAGRLRKRFAPLVILAAYLAASIIAHWDNWAIAAAGGLRVHTAIVWAIVFGGVSVWLVPVYVLRE